MSVPQRKMRPERLTPEEARRRHREVSDWTLRSDRLEMEVEFEDFDEAVEFVNRVAAVARDSDHHPDILLSYKMVRLELTTHMAGGLTEKDFEVAAEIDRLFDPHSA